MGTYAYMVEIGYRGRKHCSIDKPFPSHVDDKKHGLLSKAFLRSEGIDYHNKLSTSHMLSRVLVNNIGSTTFANIANDDNGHTLHQKIKCTRPDFKSVMWYGHRPEHIL